MVDTKPQKKITVTGGLFLFSLFFTCLLGDIFLLFPPLLLVFPFSWRAYRSWCDFLAAWWFRISVFFYEYVMGTSIVTVGDDIFQNNKETAIIIANHRTRLDWQFLWCLLHRTGTLQREKIVLKYGLKNVPGFGWAMQKFCFLFLHRRWEQDEKNITRVLEHYSQHDYNFQLLIFPEGTDLCPDNRIKSYAYSEKNNLPRVEYTLYPRTRGLTHTLSLTRHKIDAVYNVTIGYLPEQQIPQSEKELLQLQLPNEIHFHVQRIPIREVPIEEEKASEWISELWRKKEADLKDFYEKKRFPGKRLSVDPQTTTLLFSVFVWICFVSLALYGMFNYSLVRWYVLVVVIAEVVISKLGGADYLELIYHKTADDKKRR
ncbi:lysocardiolipin acyltransferase 1-like [Planoprotostelium fungivorum]|uniref:Lysocardiolipin acyltransferase 1-like n=1 Tax=Planoprotostelium fungivorum TaxID=1890364 RepID=A0A2P6MXX3_9EUKA|nr:lysocardiolipin acyltransferase 1-like [Planoprotostelium fungivorum]